MKLFEAVEAMQSGASIRRHGWRGCWFYDVNADTMRVRDPQSADDNKDVLELSPIFLLECYVSDDWEIVPVKKASLDFPDAIRLLKQGKRVQRSGWNGKNQYIELATCISYRRPDGIIMNCNHADIGNHAIAFVGTSGTQMGWLASQADMLAEDWQEV